MTITDYKIEKLTTEYVQEEDRVRLNLTDPQSNRSSLWFTQRLLNRMIPALVKVLEEETQGQPQSSDLQAFNQAQAQQSIEQDSPVAPADSSWLVHRIDMTPSKTKVVLVFTDGDNTSARLDIPRKALRQWLSIVRELYKHAGWSTEFWPSWLKPLSGQDHPNKSRLH